MLGLFCELAMLRKKQNWGESRECEQDVLELYFQEDVLGLYCRGAELGLFCGEVFWLHCQDVVLALLCEKVLTLCIIIELEGHMGLSV